MLLLYILTFGIKQWNLSVLLRTHVAGSVRKLSWCTQSGMRHENRRNHLGRLGTSFNSAFLLDHLYFVAGTVCKSSAHDATLKLCSFCPRNMTHEFKKNQPMNPCIILQGHHFVPATEILRENGFDT